MEALQHDAVDLQQSPKAAFASHATMLSWGSTASCWSTRFKWVGTRERESSFWNTPPRRVKGKRLGGKASLVPSFPPHLEDAEGLKVTIT